MTYHSFEDLVEDFSNFADRPALAIKPFLKIERLNYGQLQAKTYQTANYLLSKNIKNGDRIMIVANNCPQWIELFLGAQLIGATIIPVDASSTLATLEEFIKQTKPKLIFRSKYLLAGADKSASSYIIEELHDQINDFPATQPSEKPSGESNALIVFTSGTTAAPKGVILSQRNVLSNIEGIQSRIKINPNWRLLSVLPLSHMYELTGSLAVLSRGSSINYVPRVTPQVIAKALQEYKVTAMLAIPQLLILLLERIKYTAESEGKAGFLDVAMKIASILPFRSRRLLFRSVHSRLGGSLDLVITGGAPIPYDVALSWERMGVRTVQGYGLTETSPILTVNRIEKPSLDSPGYPLDNLELRIAEDGEIQAKGPNVFSGYLDNEPATKAAFTKDGWFKTGDVGHLQNGLLYIKGRLKFVIVLSSGLKVFPEDVELVATKHPAFKSICIVGIKEQSGETVQAIVISDKSDSDITKAITEINDKLAPFQHITGWHRWPESDFPRTRLLKIDRKKVQDWANATSDSKELPLDTKLDSHDSLSNIIRLSLDLPSATFQETDRLADIGLDSLRRLNLLALIEEEGGVTVAEELVTHNTTIAQLRKLIAQGTSSEAPPKRANWTYMRPVRLLGNSLREIVIRPLLRIWVKIRVEGRDNLKGLNGPAIFIFNHVDDFDGPVVFQALPHTIRQRLAVAVADDVMNEHKLLEFLARLCYAGFNFARKEPYMPSLEYVSHMVDQGWNVVIAPEGRISTSGHLQSFKSGIGLLAVELGVPVVIVKTIGLRGTVPLHARWPKKHSQVTVRISKPILFNQHENYDEVTQKLRNIMKSL